MDAESLSTSHLEFAAPSSSSDCTNDDLTFNNTLSSFSSSCALKNKVKRKSEHDQLPLTGKKPCNQKNSSASSVFSIFADESFALNTSSTSSLTDGAANSSFLSTSDNDYAPILPHNEEVFDWLNKFESWNDIDKVQALTWLVKKCNLSQVRHVRRTIEPLFQKDFISQLPVELALNVLSFLSARDLLNAAMTCRNWRKLSEDKLLWQEKCRIAKICPNSLPPPPSSDIVLQSPSTIDDADLSKAVYLRHRKIHTNWRRGPPLREIILRSHDDHVITCLQINGDLIVSGSDDNTLKIWSLTTGCCLHTLQGHTGGVWCSQLTESGDTVVSGSTDRTVKVWSTQTGRCVHTLSGHTSTVRCMALKNNILVSGSRDTTLRVWDINTGECLHCLTGHVAAVRCVQFDGRRAVSGAYDYTIKVWDVESESCLHTLAGHTNRVYSLKFDSERNIVVSGSLDTSIRVWDIINGQCLFTLVGHQSLTSGMELRDKILVSGNADSTLKVWDITTGRCLHTLAGPHKHISAVTSLQFLESGLVATSSDDGTVKLWDTLTGEFVRNIVRLPSGGSGGCIWRLRATPTTLICAVGSRNGTEDTKLERHVIVSGSLDTSIRVWDIINGQCLFTLVGHQSLTSGMELRDKILVSGNADSMLKVWDITTGRCLHTLAGPRKHISGVTSLQFLESGLVATSSDDGTLNCGIPRRENSFETLFVYAAADLAAIFGVCERRRRH